MEVVLSVIKAQRGLENATRPELEQRAKDLERDVAQACLEVVRLLHTPSASEGEKVDADLALAALLAERQAVRNELERKGPERGH